MLGIIAAMDEEIAQIIDKMEDVRKMEKAGMTFCCGKLGGKDAVCVRSGIGKINAAVCAQILVDHYGVDALINTGIAGSLNAKIDIGDVVLSDDVVHHDVDAIGFGYPLGQIPRMDVFSFRADETLRNLAKEVCEEVNPGLAVHIGRVCSGDQFVSSQEKKDFIVKNFDGYCTEMEGAAIAQTAYLNNVPFLIVRAISDKADNSATMDYPQFEAMAIENSVRLLLGIAARY